MDLASVVSQWQSVEDTLQAARRELLGLQATLATTGQPLPQSAVDDYNRQRSDAAQKVVYFVSRVQEQIRAAPFVGEGIANRLGDTNAWGQAFLERVPPLRRNVQTGQFGIAPAVYAIAQLLVIVGGIAAALYLSAELLKSFNDQAVVSEAEAHRLTAWASGQATIVKELRLAGATPEQILAKLDLKPPSAPDAGWGIGKILGVVGGLGLIGYLVYLATGKRRTA